MAVLTESSLRSPKYRDQLQEAVLKLPKGTILTPSAKSFLQERKITVEFIEVSSVEANDEESVLGIEEDETHVSRPPSFKYRLVSGGFLNKKPEHMTALHSNVLVFKDDSRIVLRGKLESLEAEMMEGQLRLAVYPSLVEDLTEMLDFVREMLHSETMDQALREIHILNMNESEIQEMVHQPEKYFGEAYFTPDYRMGEAIVVLNRIRTIIRETELSAYQVYKNEDGTTERSDLILALNRLSSVCWILMFKYKTGEYQKTKER